MRLYAPKYYTEFCCIADRCRHSCCIGWEIDVDERTLEVYQALDGYGETVRSSICTDGDTPHFALCKGERCPHLTDRGLCSIILHCGEEYLCDICREHPRFYHGTSRGLEVGLGMSCEEAARLILSTPWKGEMTDLGQTEEGWTHPFDADAFRKELFGILFDEARPYGERLARIYKTYGVSPAQDTDARWRARIAELEYLDPAHRALFSVYSSSLGEREAYADVLERALAYLVFRHCAEVYDEDELFAALGFCLFCERLLASLLLASGGSFEDAVECARILSEELEYSEDNTEAIKAFFLEP